MLPVRRCSRTSSVVMMKPLIAKDRSTPTPSEKAWTDGPSA